MRTTLALMILLVANTAFGQVLVVNIWDPEPGKGNLTLQYAAEAKAIMEKLDVQVVVATDQMGHLHYATNYADWEAWGKFQKKLDASEEWAAFLQKIGQAPSAVPTDVYMMDQLATAEPGNVYQVSIWRSFPGQGAKTVETATGAKPIHEKLGAAVEINVDQLGRLHYVQSFASWEAWGAYQAKVAASEEWQNYINPFLANPSAELVKTYMGTVVP